MGSRGPLLIKCVAPIGKKDAGTNRRLASGPGGFVDLREWIGKGLEQMARDHEVLALVRKAEAVDVKVGDDVGLGNVAPASMW